MNPLRTWLAALLFPLALGACATSQTGPKGLAGLPARGESPAQRLFRAAGDQAVVTLLLNPLRFSELQDGAPLLTILDQGPRALLGRALRAPSLWAALGELAQSTTPWPADLKGWDPARPVVLALFAASATDAGTLAVTFLQPGSTPRAPLYTRHRLLIPATDPAALAQSLAELIGSIKGAPSARQPGVYGGRGFLLTINGAGDHVRLEVLIDSRKADAEPPWDLLPELTVPPLAPPPQSAAQHLTLQGEDAVAVYVRPDRLRALSLVQGTGNILAALESVDPGMRSPLAAQGWAELAGGDLILGSGGGEVQDAALALSAGPAGPQLTTVLDLTAAGSAAWTAAAQGALRPKLTWGEPVVARFTMAVDLATLLQKVPLPQGVPTDTLRAMTRRVQECGAACLLYLGLRSPLGTLRVAVTAQAGLLDILPRAGDVVLTAAQPSSLQGSLALVVPETPLVTKLLGLLDRQLGADAKPRVRHSAVPAGGGLVLHRFGLEQDPTTVYAPELTRGVGDLLSLEVNAAPLRAALSGKDNELARLVASYRGLRTRVALSGSTLVARTVMPRAPAGALAPPPLPQLTGKPLPPEPAPTPGEICLQQAQEALVQAFGNLASVEPSLRPTILQAAEHNLAAPLRCAQQDLRTRSSAERLHQALALAQQLFAAPPQSR